MKQQILEARLAEIEAIANQSIKDGMYVGVILKIIEVTRRDKGK